MMQAQPTNEPQDPTASGLKRSRDCCPAQARNQAPTVPRLVLPAAPSDPSDGGFSTSPDCQMQAVSPSGPPSPPGVHSNSSWHPAKSQPLYGCYADIGGRGYMEDRYLCTTVDGTADRDPLTVAAVFDGHGSSTVAEFLESNMAAFIQAELSHGHSDDAVALHQAYLAADAALKQTHNNKAPSMVGPTLQDELGGSTAVVVLCSDDAIICANCGDSRAVLARGGHQAIALSDDHRPDRRDELVRIHQAGGCVMHFCGCPRVMGVLAMSRALGDLWLQRFGVSATPEVKAMERDMQDEFVIVASDGLWTAVSNEEAVHLARRCLRRAANRGAGRAACLRIAAKVLAQLAEQRGNKDNITVVLVDLQQPDAKASPCPYPDAQRQQRQDAQDAAVEASLLHMCSGKGSASSAQLATAGSGDSPSRHAPITPRPIPPPNAAILTPRSKPAAATAAEQPSGCDDDVLCQVLVQSAPQGASNCNGTWQQQPAGGMS